jgi:hypothetical protein
MGPGEAMKYDLSDPRLIGAGLATIGLLAGAAGGYVRITTPEAAQCAVDLADAKARLELLAEVKDSCKTALAACVAAPKETP